MGVIDIAGRKIGEGHPCFIIAEAGVNHNGQVELAKQLVDIACRAGADAVKFQTFRAENVVSASAPKAEYQKRSGDPGESQLDMARALELSEPDHIELSQYCRFRKILFLSSPFDEECADLLDRLGVPVFKVASGEITNWPLLEYVARKGKPVILSTGMAFLSEVKEAVRVLNLAGCSELALLQCTSCYPTDAINANLRAMETMSTSLNVPIGFSDHSLGINVALAAVALGACIIEKHFTLDKLLPGPDHQASLDAGELAALVQGIRAVEAALGDGIKRPMGCEQDVRDIARRSIVAGKSITSGTILTQALLAFKRPGTGIPPSQLLTVVGRKTTRALAPDTVIQQGDLE